MLSFRFSPKVGKPSTDDSGCVYDYLALESFLGPRGCLSLLRRRGKTKDKKRACLFLVSFPDSYQCV